MQAHVKSSQTQRYVDRAVMRSTSLLFRPIDNALNPCKRKNVTRLPILKMGFGTETLLEKCARERSTSVLAKAVNHVTRTTISISYVFRLVDKWS
eukprot:9211708-Pyramimonas_sp.AAC.1